MYLLLYPFTRVRVAKRQYNTSYNTRVEGAGYASVTPSEADWPYKAPTGKFADRPVQFVRSKPAHLGVLGSYNRKLGQFPVIFSSPNLPTSAFELSLDFFITV